MTEYEPAITIKRGSVCSLMFTVSQYQIDSKKDKTELYEITLQTKKGVYPTFDRMYLEAYIKIGWHNQFLYLKQRDVLWFL